LLAAALGIGNTSGTIIAVPGVTTNVTWTGIQFNLAGAYPDVRWSNTAFESNTASPRVLWESESGQFVLET